MVDLGAKFKGKESLEMGDRHFSKDDTAKQSETDYFGRGDKFKCFKTWENYVGCKTTA